MSNYAVMKVLRRNARNLFLRTAVIAILLMVLQLLFMSRIDSQPLHVVMDYDKEERQTNRTERQKDPIRHTTRTRMPHRIMALSYHEQLNTALKYEMFSLATVAADFNALVVEPLLVSSRLYGLKKLVPTVDQEHLSSTVPLEDVVEFRGLLHQCTGVDMVPFSTFMSAVPRKVVLVYIQTYGVYQPREITLDSHFQNVVHAQLKSHDNPVMNCTKMFEDRQDALLRNIESALTKNSSGLKPSEIVQVLCLDHRSVVGTSDIWSHFPKALISDEEDHLIMFLNWRGCFILDCSQGNYERWSHNRTFRANQNRYKVITRHSIAKSSCFNEAVMHSKFVKGAAETYLNSSIVRRPFVGVHIRIERLVKGAVENGLAGKNFLNCVLNKLAITVTGLQRNHSLKQILVCTDFDQYHGTDTCNKHTFCRESGKYIHSIIEHKFGWKIAKFNPLSFGLPNNAGFVSLVEMNILMSSEHLILVGHGNFQDQLLAHYLSSGISYSYSRIAEASECTLFTYNSA